MENSSMCRICLAEDVPSLHLVVNSRLREMYEFLTSMPFETKDNRPQRACNVCSAKLENCYQLRKLCLRSEELFSQMLDSDMLVPAGLEEFRLIHRLTRTPVAHWNIVPEEEHYTQCEIKLEPRDVLEDVDVKVEHGADFNNAEVKMEYVEGTVPPVQMNPENSISSHIKVNEAMKIREIKEIDNQIPVIEKPVTKNKLLVKCDKEDMNLYVKRKNRVRDRVSKITRSNNKPPHTKNKSLICETCQKCFKYKSDLDRHVRTHTGEKPYQCDICNKSLSDKTRLKNHLRTHTGEKPFKCNICNKCLSDKTRLKYHIRTHTGEKPFKCNICNKYFSERGHLTQHIYTHNGEKPYPCNICQKAFIKKSNLTNHVRIHTGEKPHQCNYCNKFFILKNDLTNHIRTHTGEKPYQCNICKRFLSYKRNLINHIRTHTGEKPYQCHMCKKCFLLKNKLACHMRTHI